MDTHPTAVFENCYLSGTVDKRASFRGAKLIDTDIKCLKPLNCEMDFSPLSGWEKIKRKYKEYKEKRRIDNLTKEFEMEKNLIRDFVVYSSIIVIILTLLPIILQIIHPQPP